VGALCARRDACAVSTDRTLWGAACVQAGEAGCDAVDGAGLDRSFADFDRAAADECSVAVQAAECGVVNAAVPPIDACLAAFGAARADGSSCANDHDCGSGRCVRRFDQCGVCTASASAGDVCDSATHPCAAGLFCHQGGCRPRRSENTRCDVDGECGAGLYCAASLLCKAQHATGGVCRDDRDYQDCVETAYCSLTVCADPVQVGLSRSCAERGKVCAVGGICSGGDCSPILASGDLCTDHASCGLTGACFEGTCGSRGAVSEACEGDRGCHPGLVCLGGICAQVKECR
jgi:hypothetical protein